MNYMLTEEAARKLTEMVRRLEAQVKGIDYRQRVMHSGDNEWIIDAVAVGTCEQWSLGECVPNLAPESYPTHYWNTLGDIEDGADIVIAYSHRSSGSSARNLDANTPTPWIVIAASCNDPQAFQFNIPNNSQYLATI